MYDDLHPLHRDPLVLHGFFDGDDSSTAVANLKSIVVARAHEFCFSYEFVLHLIRSRESLGAGPLDGVDRLEFLRLIEFREDEIRRVMLGGDPSWKWPATWTPSWCSDVRSCVGPDLDLALAQTIQGAAVQKALLGHGSRVALDEAVTMRVTDLVSLLLEGPHFAPIPRFPLILSSYDRPPTECSRSQEYQWNFDRVLGEYRRPSHSYISSSEAHHQILLHERALRACSKALSIDARRLRAIVVLHECAHYFVDRLPGRPDLPECVGWVDRGYEKTSAEVHETIAQLLTFWTCQDSWLREDFEKLNARQSPEYRRFRDIIDAGASYPTVVAAIANARKRDLGTDFATWKRDLGM